MTDSYGSKEDRYPPSVLFERLRSLELKPDDYAVFGSGPLAIRGLLDHVGDLDIITRGSAWDTVMTMGEIVMYGEDVTVDLGNGLTFGRSWAYGDFDIDQLIDEAETIQGIRFAQMSAVVEFKRIAARPKDLEHLELLAHAGLIQTID